MQIPVNPPIKLIIAVANRLLADIVRIDAYEYTPCYLWYDSPLYNEFGEAVANLAGDTIYLQHDSATPVRDLFHELGHVVSRYSDLIGNAGNGYRGIWQDSNRKLIAEVSAQRHWSEYLNLFSISHSNFGANAASEVWAELFMIWHLYPHWAEARLLDEAMNSLQGQAVYDAVTGLALELGLPRRRSDQAPAPVL